MRSYENLLGRKNTSIKKLTVKKNNCITIIKTMQTGLKKKTIRIKLKLKSVENNEDDKNCLLLVFPKPMILQVPKPVVLMILTVLNLKDLSMLLLNFKFFNFLILSDNFLRQSQFLELFDNQFRAKCKYDNLKIPLVTSLKPYGKNSCQIKDALNTWYLRQRNHKKYCRFCANCRANQHFDSDCYCGCSFCEEELRYEQEFDYDYDDDDDASN